MKIRKCVGCGRIEPTHGFTFRMPICGTCFGDDPRYPRWFAESNNPVFDLWHKMNQETGDILFEEWWKKNA